MEMASQGDTTNGEIARQLSRGIVDLHKKYLGRGASHARSHVHDDLAVTLLSGTMTHAEETLKEENRDEMVREQRRVFQDAFRKEAIALAEQITGRDVVAFLSDHAVDPDYAIEVFVFAPGGDV
jgi:uncharacterized protein YbcI